MSLFAYTVQCIGCILQFQLPGEVSKKEKPVATWSQPNKLCVSSDLRLDQGDSLGVTQPTSGIFFF